MMEEYVNSVAVQEEERSEARTETEQLTTEIRKRKMGAKEAETE